MSEWHNEFLSHDPVTDKFVTATGFHQIPDVDEWRQDGWSLIEEREDYIAMVYDEDIEEGFSIVSWWIRKEA